MTADRDDRELITARNHRLSRQGSGLVSRGLTDLASMRDAASDDNAVPTEEECVRLLTEDPTLRAWAIEAWGGNANTSSPRMRCRNERRT